MRISGEPIVSTSERSSGQFGKGVDFYNTYLSVIFGLLATLGLTDLVTFSGHEEQPLNTLSITLFLGTFITSIRLWLASASIDDISQDFYGIVAKTKHSHFNALLVVDTVFATTFAGLLLAMFLAIPPTDLRFFGLFLWVAGFSLAYDFYSYLLVRSTARPLHEQTDDQVVDKYAKNVAKWVKHDVVFVVVATALFLGDVNSRMRNSPVVGFAFVLASILQVIIEFGPLLDAR
jgi:hypothetical protein